MVNIDLYAWVIRGVQRIAVIKAITHPMTPSQIFKKAKAYHEKLSFNNTSDVLRGFDKKGIAVCHNHEEKIGRIYQLSQDGEEIKQELIKS